MMTPEERKEARIYAWGYFALHADQRMKLFNFFRCMGMVDIDRLTPQRTGGSRCSPSAVDRDRWMHKWGLKRLWPRKLNQ